MINKAIQSLVQWLLFVFALPLCVQAQYGNEWINYQQSYWKLKVVQDGWYRVSAAQLAAAGFPTASIDPRKIQLFYRGQEMAIYVNGEQDGVFDNTDYIEFYGRKNDGANDADLYYPNTANHLNPYYNLHSDTSAYFITYRLDAGNGKRITQSNLPDNSYPTLSYGWTERLQVPAEQCSPGRNYVISGSYVFISSYDVGEGWASNPIGAGGNRILSFNIQAAAYGIAEKPIIEVKLVSRRYYTATLSIDVGSGSNYRTVGSLNVSNYAPSTFTQTLEWSDFPGSSGTFNVRIRNTSTNGMQASIVYVRLRYPRSFNAQNSEFYFEISSQSNHIKIPLSNLPSNARLFELTDLYNIQEVNLNAGVAVLPPSSSTRKFLLQSNVLNVAAVETANFVAIDPSAYNYLIVSHPKLMQAAGGYNDPVAAYAAYRASAQGGSYSPLVMNIFILYDQFNYGEVGPLAIRRFARYMYDNGNPQFLFLIGEGVTLPFVDAVFGNVSTALNIRNNPTDFARNLIPTWGYPGSDLPITAGFDPTYPYAPAIPTGRVSCNTAEQLANYLNKVKEHESTSCAYWRKRLLHLSGGVSVSEQNAFRSFVDFYKSVAEGDYLHAEVKTLSKKSTETVEFINISEEVNRGVALVTFFGHSAATLTDIDIGFVSADGNGYRNQGKYPMILANGCSVGDVYSAKTTLANDWLYAPNRGAIAWKANSSLGGAAWLHNYTTRWYSIAFAQDVSFSAPLGKIDQYVAQSYGPGLGPGIDLAHVQQMTLQGDPALRLIGPNLPDLCTQDAWLSLESFDRGQPVAQSDSLRLKLIVASAGKHSNQSFSVKVTRTFPDGSSQVFYPIEKYGPIKRFDTLSITIYQPKDINTAGLNRFEVKVDGLSEIEESNEDNNIAVLEYNLPGIAVIARFPVEYTIVSQQPVKLVAQSSNLLANNAAEVIFEIDTTAFFNSPAKQSAIRPLEGGTATWEVHLLTDQYPSDSLVYFWRVNLASVSSNPNALWSESSFTYIKNSPEGWAQRHFYQFRKSIDQQIEKDFAARRWKFAQVNNTIKVQTYGASHPDVNNSSLYINGLGIVFNYPNNTCANNRLIVMAIDRKTKNPYVLSNYGLCGRVPGYVSSFTNSDLQNGLLQAYVNTLPTGDYLVVFSKGQISTTAWQAAQSALLQVGASPAKIATLQTGHPYILIGRKGGPALAEVISSSISAPASDAISAEVQLGGGFNSGTVTSSLIGPAAQWGTVFFEWRAQENPSTDQTSIDVVGVRFNGQEDLLMSNVFSGQDLSNIDVLTYPYLRLRMNTKDENNQTPSQLRQWIVRYQGVAEGFLNIEAAGGAAVYQIPDKLEGEPLSIPFVFENISERYFESDSLEVEYTLRNSTLNKNRTYTLKIKAPAPKQQSRFSIEIPTAEWSGNNRLKVYVNPKKVPEQYYDNNQMELDFKVLEDNKNPNLEVTFDGIRIMNGDIVSPNALIRIRLHDDNPYLIKQDTSGMSVELRRPCEGCGFERIYFSNPQVRWSAQKGEFVVEYQAKDLEDGLYALRVQGTDAKGNAAGTQPYEVEFEVVNETSISHFYPYPNPFSSSCRFIFTLTGKEVPQEIKIQIMTVSGKVVREITQDEIGPIHIGNNITQYAWDGTDEYGDRLANGVYLYRVLVRLNGKMMPLRATAGDRAFKQGFGKLYILR
jgi:flagellar hook assembly protein FlgD